MPKHLTDTDVAIIGAGVIGCATAARIARHFRVTMIERHPAVAMETSGRNSGVIHSGVHLPPDSNKAALARRGKAMMEEYCFRHRLECQPVGMHIVVPKQGVFNLRGEVPRLLQMLNRAKDQKIRVAFCSGKAIRQREPAIEALFGLHIPDVSIVSAPAVTRRLHDEATAAGATTRFLETVTAVQPRDHGWTITTTSGTLSAACVINAAGLYADRIARLAGFDHQHYLYRGEYYRIRPESGIKLNGLIYPVHQPGRPGLGVHLTRTVDGQMLIGPNAKRVHGPDDYETDPTPAVDFYAEVKRFVPTLDLSHLIRHPAGIRPKLSDSPGENDFKIVWDHKTFLNLIGIESPGLTAALAIAADINNDVLHRLPAF